MNVSNLDEPIDLKSYNNKDNAFECPCDGYFALAISYSVNNRASANIYGHDKAQYITLTVTGNSQSGMVNSIFVKKGMYITVDSGQIGLAWARFHALT